MDPALLLVSAMYTILDLFEDFSLYYVLSLSYLGGLRGISGGQRRRLSIAKALISMPSLCFLDEPTSGLSTTDAAQVRDSLDSCHVGHISSKRFVVFSRTDVVFHYARARCRCIHRLNISDRTRNTSQTAGCKLEEFCQYCMEICGVSCPGY